MAIQSFLFNNKGSNEKYSVMCNIQFGKFFDQIVISFICTRKVVWDLRYSLYVGTTCMHTHGEVNIKQIQSYLSASSITKTTTCCCKLCFIVIVFICARKIRIMLGGKNVLITGASRGLGLEVVRQLLRGNVKSMSPSIVIATCRQPDQAPELQALAAEEQNRLYIKKFDVTNFESYVGFMKDEVEVTSTTFM